MRALFIRTITADQDCAAHLHASFGVWGWRWPREFVDLGQSVTKAFRSALDEMRRPAKAGELREDMAYARDRLGRSRRDLLLLLDDLTACGDDSRERESQADRA